MYGELIPLGGGDPIPLIKKKLLIGRRESCDIVLRFANVSAHHCELSIDSGYWYIRDLQSRNGVKINDVRVQERRLDSGDSLSVAKHHYRIEYSPADLGAVGPPPSDNLAQEVMRKSLLERAGLENTRRQTEPMTSKRYDPNNMKAGQIDLPDKPV
ncbi:Transcriptional regulatory protein EmbR [Pirellulimonas nuda]|uniref:Transcriptional regulatory protein EmbR n=1 Tax=Pirellulimonas nuda TaxID=2528009 RepID=A0A518DGE3_9BACT|nr:FHA domain-containing protein [Pirellulimonas nuda]QDU90544.1 Transcriptional regulatory protein EmbR [Pirellulimonas nuda]